MTTRLLGFIVFVGRRPAEACRHTQGVRMWMGMEQGGALQYIHYDLTSNKARQETNADAIVQ